MKYRPHTVPPAEGRSCPSLPGMIQLLGFGLCWTSRLGYGPAGVVIEWLEGRQRDEQEHKQGQLHTACANTQGTTLDLTLLQSRKS